MIRISRKILVYKLLAILIAVASHTLDFMLKDWSFFNLKNDTWLLNSVYYLVYEKHDLYGRLYLLQISFCR